MARKAAGKEALTPQTLLAVARRFCPDREVLEVCPFGQGHIHETFLVTLKDTGIPAFILQRLNTRVFPDPFLVMANLVTVTSHVAKRLAAETLPAGRRFEIPRPLPAQGDQGFLLEAQGGCWRALTFIPGALTLLTIRDLEHAFEVGYALGLFHRLVADLPPGLLGDTLPGFHITPLYLRAYDEIRARRPPRGSPEENFCCDFIEKRRKLAGILEEAKAAGHLHLHIIHGDPKVDNVLLDERSRRAVSLVDLDTVRPGLRHYDLGDCLRSACNPAGEDPASWEEVRFEVEICRAVLKGYNAQAGSLLTPADRHYLFPCIRLLPFELGLRFFTDYLAGNVYFRTKDEEQNLRRAAVQFHLTASIERQAGAIRKILRDVFP